MIFKSAKATPQVVSEVVCNVSCSSDLAETILQGTVKRKEDKADRKRDGKTTSRNGQETQDTDEFRLRIKSDKCMQVKKDVLCLHCLFHLQCIHAEFAYGR